MQGPTPCSRPDGGMVADVNLGAPELIILLVLVLLLFGGAKLPKLARSLGQAQGEFKKGIDEGAKKADADSSKDDEA